MNYKDIPLSNSTFDKLELDILTQIDKNKTTNRKYQRYIQVLNQMIGMFSIAGNINFVKRQNELLSLIFTNGMCVISYFDNQLQLWSVAGEIMYNINGDLEFVDVLPYTKFNSNKKLKVVRLKGNQCVVIKANPNAFSLWFLWNTIISDNVELFEIYLTNAKLNVKKLQYIVNNDSVSIATDEINSILDYHSPVLKTINPITKFKTGNLDDYAGEQNILQPLELSNGDYYFNDVVNHWVFETNLMGLFADEYKKKERNTTGENEFTQANTILLQTTILREFKTAEIEIKEKFNIDVHFSKTLELSVEKESKGVDDDKTK